MPLRDQDCDVKDDDRSITAGKKVHCRIHNTLTRRQGLQPLTGIYITVSKAASSSTSNFATTIQMGRSGNTVTRWKKR